MKSSIAVVISTGLLCALLPLVAPGAAGAESSDVGGSRRVGIGFIAGEPTGLSGKYWLGRNEAMDFGAAWSFTDEASFHLHADYLVHDFSVFTPDEGRMPLYYGVGGRIKFQDESRIGFRGVVGLNYIFDTAPVDVFVEIAPVLDLAPKTDFNLMGGIGLRMFFGPSWQ